MKLQSVTPQQNMPQMIFSENFVSRESLFFSLIKNNPGIRFNEMMKLSGLKNGVVSHYIHQLEHKGIIYSIRTPRITRFYSQNISEHSQIIFKWLRQSTPHKIILALLDDALYFKELVKKVGKSPSNTSYFTTKLIKDEIVLCSLKDKKKIYFVNPDKRNKLHLILHTL